MRAFIAHMLDYDANALRTDFIRQLKIITDLVNRLDMPCAVIGLGMQRELKDTTWNFPFDEVTKDFFNFLVFGRFWRFYSNFPYN